MTVVTYPIPYYHNIGLFGEPNFFAMRIQIDWSVPKNFCDCSLFGKLHPPLSLFVEPYFFPLQIRIDSSIPKNIVIVGIESLFAKLRPPLPYCKFSPVHILISEMTILSVLTNVHHPIKSVYNTINVQRFLFPLTNKCWWMVSSPEIDGW